MPADEIERKDRRVVGKRDHAPAEFNAEGRFDGVRIKLEPRIELTAVIARGAPARLLGFEDDRVGPLPGEMQRGRKYGKAATDDRDRHGPVGLERRRRNRRNGGIGIKAWSQRKRS